MNTAEPTAVLAFLRCRTPADWIAQAVSDPARLLRDHASLELKAAQQAQTLIRRYGAAPARGPDPLPAGFRSRLVHRMSRLAREELKHFEQVLVRIEARGGRLTSQSASRYAGGLHALIRKGEPAALVDALIIGAIIEARSCERFFSLLAPLQERDGELAEFYASLLRSEARHFEDYLKLAALPGDPEFDARIETLLRRDAELIEQPDPELRFHSGPPVAAAARPARI